MPEGDDEHGDHDVEVDSPLLVAARASQWIVDIVTNPVAQGDVPATPETSDTRGLVGAIKVLGELDSKEASRADCDVGVA